MTKILLAFLLLSGTSVFAKSSSTNNFIEIRKGHSLYVEHHPAAAGRPTVFLLNGLTYSTKQYDDFVRALRDQDPGVGIVAYDMVGMGQTLLQNPETRKNRVPVENQVRDLHDLVRTLQIPGPLSVAGLSYGGGIELLYATMFPNDFANFIAFAPVIERLPDQDYLLRNSVTWHKIWNPGDPRNDDELYDHYLRNWIYLTYPVAEPVILENPYKLEAVFRMVQGIKNWNAFENVSRLPDGKIHLIAAVDDEHVKVGRLNEYWKAIPEAARASYLRLEHSTHKIPEVWPKIAAAWTLHILNGNPELQRGRIFEGDPYGAEANSGGIKVPLSHSPKKVGFCETILREVSK